MSGCSSRGVLQQEQELRIKNEGAPRKRRRGACSRGTRACHPELPAGSDQHKGRQEHPDKNKVKPQLILNIGQESDLRKEVACISAAAALLLPNQSTDPSTVHCRAELRTVLSTNTVHLEEPTSTRDRSVM